MFLDFKFEIPVLSRFPVMVLEININISVVIIGKIIVTIATIRDHAARFIILQQIIGLQSPLTLIIFTRLGCVHLNNT